MTGRTDLHAVGQRTAAAVSATSDLATALLDSTGEVARWNRRSARPASSRASVLFRRGRAAAPVTR